jgi:hypothetical protein
MDRSTDAVKPVIKLNKKLLNNIPNANDKIGTSIRNTRNVVKIEVLMYSWTDIFILDLFKSDFRSGKKIVEMSSPYLPKYLNASLL